MAVFHRIIEGAFSRDRLGVIILCSFTAFFTVSIGSASAGEVVVQAFSKDVGYQRLGFKIKKRDLVSRTELMRMEEFIVKRGFEIPWRFDSLPDSEYFASCPYYSDTLWYPCLPYDRAAYVSCVAEYQSKAVSGLATREIKETCHLESASTTVLDQLKFWE